MDMMLSKLPVIKVNNYAFKNMDGLKFQDVSAAWGIQIPSFSNGATYGDLDNDGDLDYVVNNINDKAFVYRNNTIDDRPDKAHYLRIKFNGTGLNKQALGARIEGQFTDGSRFYYENTPYRGYLSSVEPFAHIGLGSKRVKEMHVIWPNDLMEVIKYPKIDQVLTVDIRNANLPMQGMFTQPEPLIQDISKEFELTDVHQEYDFVDFNFQSLLPFKMSELGPGASAGDVNGDGFEDFFVGGAKFYSGIFYLQQASGKFNRKPIEGINELKTKLGEDLGSLLIDMDRDGDLDLYIARGGTEDKIGASSYQDVVYSNDGQGNFSKIENFMDFIVERNNRHENRRIVQLIHFRKNSQDSVQSMNDMLYFCSAVSG
jgi:hypothetical protein